MTIITDLRYGAALLLCLIMLMICSQVTAQDDSCDYILSLSESTRLHFHSQNYTGPAKGGLLCRWRFVCPEGLKCHLDCPRLSAQGNENCNGDRLLFSPNGDGNLANAERVCANGAVELKSIRNELVVGLQIAPGSPGGEFDCMVSAGIF